MKNKEQSAVIREYMVGGMTYVVKASVKTGVTERAEAKVKRLIKNEVRKQSAN